MIDQLARSEGRQDALEGLQEAPSSISFHGQQGVMRGKLYQGSLDGSYSRMSVADRLRGAAPLLKGLAYIQDKGLVHVDIKPGNIFVDQNSRGQPIFRLADFGGARLEHEIPPGKGLPHTPHFTPHPQLEPMNSSNPRSLHAIGTFQMGVSLFQILSGGKYPYPQTPPPGPPYQLTNQPFNEAALAGYPSEVVDFVKAMVHPDPSQRPVGGEITAKFNQLTAKFGSLEGMVQAAEQGIQKFPRVFSQLNASPLNKGPLPQAQAEHMLRTFHRTSGGRPAFVMRYSQSQNAYVISGIRQDGQIQHVKLNDFIRWGNDAFDAARAFGFA